MKYKDVIGTKVDICGTNFLDGWDNEKLYNKIGGVLKDNLFDNDFYLNWTDNTKEYWEVFKKTTLLPLLNNIEETFDTFFEYKTTPYSTLRKVFVFKNPKDYIDNWFQTNLQISKELWNDYYNYRREYAGVELTHIKYT